MIWLGLGGGYTLQMGPFLDEDDGKTVESGLTIVQADVRISKNGGAFAQKNDTQTATYDENGYYQVPIDSNDAGIVGRIKVAIHKSGALPVWKEYQIVPSQVYNSMVIGSDKLEADAVQLGGVTQSATDLKHFADSGYDPATSKVEGVKLVDTTTANTDVRGTDSAALATELATHDGKLDTVDGIVDNILVDTAEIGVAGLGLTDLGGMSTGMRAEIEVEVGDAITAAEPIDANLTQIDGLATSGNNATLNLKALDIQATGAIPAIKMVGGTSAPAAWVIESDTDVVHWECKTAGGNVLVATSGSAGGDVFSLIVGNDSGTAIKAQGGVVSGRGFQATGGTKGIDAVEIDAILADTADMQPKLGTPVSSVSADIAAVKTVVDAIETDTQDIQSNIGLPSDLGSGATLADNNDDMSGATFATGTDSLEAIRDRGDTAWITGAGGLTAQQARDAMKLAPTGGAPAVGSVDEHLDDILADTADMQPKLGTPAANISADIAAVKVDTAAILLDTADIQPKIGTPVATLAGDIATVDGVVDTILVDTADLQSNGVKLNAQGKLDVNAEVDTALDDSIAEPVAGAPSAVASVRTGIARLYSIARNKGTLNSVSGEKTFYNSASVAISKKAIADTGSEYSETAMTGV